MTQKSLVIAAAAALAATVGAASAFQGAAKNPAADASSSKSVAELEARHKAYLDAVDADSDGVITADERKAHRAAMMAKRRKAMFPDTNEDGLVDRFEWEEAARARFDRLDANGDGFVSEEEFAKAGQSRRGRGGPR